MADDKTFMGVGWAFPPVFNGQTRAASMVAAEIDIVESLHILMGTTPGERVMQSAYGCNLKRLVFEDMDQNTLTDIKDVISRAILLFEPRITLNEILVDDSGWIEGVLNVTLDYTILANNTRNNIVYPLYLREGSGVGYTA
ncbi:MAG: GPW/gp25 family protein [Caulobacteraceae bacterium]